MYNLLIVCFLKDESDKWLKEDKLTVFSDPTSDQFVEADAKIAKFLETRASLLLRVYPQDDNVSFKASMCTLECVSNCNEKLINLSLAESRGSCGQLAC